MERILEEQGKEVAAGGTGLAQDAAFHAAIASSTNNRAITRIVHAVIDLLTQSREESLQIAGRPTRSHEDHLRILEAIRGRRSAEARRAMLDHVVAVETLVMGRQLKHGRKPSPVKKTRR
jgi:GntR family transcriptional repressor for pyruvate dehydrogenase complex